MRYINIIVTIFFLILTMNFYGQVDKRRTHYPIWTFHQKNVDINGISFGLWSISEKPRLTNTNGIKIELLGLGMLSSMFIHNECFERDSLLINTNVEPISERINGLNLSFTGSVGHILINGVSLGLCGQNNFQINGLSMSCFNNGAVKHNGIMVSMFNDGYFINGLQLGIRNYAYKTNGIQIGFFDNESKEMNGLQIGIINKSNRLKGIQIGIWNINQKRKFPIINWSF